MDILTICIIVVWVIAIPLFIRYLFLRSKKNRLMKGVEQIEEEQTNRSE